MTSYDGSPPAPGSAGRRRALGRGPGTSPPERPEPPAHDTDAQSKGAVAENAPSAAGTGSEPAQEAALEAVTGAGTAFQEDGAASPAEGPGADLVPPAPPTGDPAPSAAVAGPSPDAVAAARGRGAAAETETLPGPAEAAGEASPDDSAGTSPGSTADDHAAPGTGVFKVRLVNFEGPFDLLLQLISKHKLDVTEVALSKVTDEFMAHIRAMGPDWDLDQTTEFLVVAATLLDLKAARLLPAAEVEDEADLALLEARDLLFARLLQYRAYKQIAEIFNRRTEEEARRHPRTVGLEPHHAELLPEVVISIGPEGFARLAVKAMQPRPRPQVYVDHIHAPLVSVQEQAGIVVARLRELGEASFRVLVEDTDDTLTVVARFLALLELYREKAVALEQEAALGELVVRWTGGDGDETPVVTDEFDRPPDEPKEEKKA
ncbi:segregation/condensation protein A [Streptomyces sp. NPDC046931]|uniref:segregation and condensation protein A n=1 Tax=Streptomyces sp. NPDC046931 TaxID=3154806 RepID=UPI0033F6BFB9